MRAVGYKHSLPIDQAESLIDIEIDKPAPQGRDLLVAGEGDLGQPGRHQGAHARRPEGRRRRRCSAMTRPAWWRRSGRT